MKEQCFSASWSSPQSHLYQWGCKVLAGSDQLVTFGCAGQGGAVPSQHSLPRP